MTAHRTSRRLHVVDDGTNYEITWGATKLMEVNKTTLQLRLKAAVDGDQDLDA